MPARPRIPSGPNSRPTTSAMAVMASQAGLVSLPAASNAFVGRMMQSIRAQPCITTMASERMDSSALLRPNTLPG